MSAVGADMNPFPASVSLGHDDRRLKIMCATPTGEAAVSTDQASVPVVPANCDGIPGSTELALSAPACVPRSRVVRDRHTARRRGCGPWALR